LEDKILGGKKFSEKLVFENFVLQKSFQIWFEEILKKIFEKNQKKLFLMNKISKSGKFQSLAQSFQQGFDFLQTK